MKSERTPYMIRIAPELLERIRQEATRIGVPINSYISMVLFEHLYKTDPK